MLHDPLELVLEIFAETTLKKFFAKKLELFFYNTIYRKYKIPINSRKLLNLKKLTASPKLMSYKSCA